MEQAYGESCVHLSLTCFLLTQVGSHQDITEESFSLFWMLEPPIGIGGGTGRGAPSLSVDLADWPHLSLEIVVVGTGDRTERLQPQVLRAMRQRGIAVEVQDTVSPGTWEH